MSHNPGLGALAYLRSVRDNLDNPLYYRMEAAEALMPFEGEQHIYVKHLTFADFIQPSIPPTDKLEYLIETYEAALTEGRTPTPASIFSSFLYARWCYLNHVEPFKLFSLQRYSKETGTKVSADELLEMVRPEGKA